ncbi:mannose-6-phosphate isomerase, class I [Metabacillus arenae]|uniref:Mannose-6-phosphate isomerase n=1 Tax=Metabacillus arenae TaxID=2771434 RepID=A0A926NSM2_9BACI|nr:mannose-6-phosphate isomerase, class I [Metabacillus arenae]MBD1383202.1 mannose-6-phosphate isomerase, class I [Metabacillus arenae]
MQPLFLKPLFKERIWGGTTLKEQFGYDIPNDHTGECWAISAHPNGPSVIKNGEFKGKTLDQLWKEHPELFAHTEGNVFPLLTKILDAGADLSVQVHPGDDYAKKNENGELGKTECWYIIDCKEEAELIYGHNAKSKEELVSMIENGQWDNLLRRLKIKPGDFFYVPSGTIHALCEGTLVLETQQSSDTTYRVYDYDRIGQDGNKRELHLEKAIDVTTIPHVDGTSNQQIEQVENAEITTFVKSDFFSVYKWSVHGEAAFNQDHPFMLVSVIKGSGKLITSEESFDFEKGTHFILPAGFGGFKLDGECELIVSHI